MPIVLNASVRTPSVLSDLERHQFSLLLAFLLVAWISTRLCMSSTLIFLQINTEVFRSTPTALVSSTSFILLTKLTSTIGRTGRIGNLGLATSFYNSSRDDDIAPALVKLLLETHQAIPDFLQSFLPEGFTADDAGNVTGNFADLKFEDADEDENA